MSAANVKRAPATALPWANDSDAPRKGKPRAMVFPENDASGEALVAGNVDPQDAAYIKHAANAYPRLVEALRNLREQVECMNAQQAFGRDYDEAVALLRELGEGA